MATKRKAAKRGRRKSARKGARKSAAKRRKTARKKTARRRTAKRTGRRTAKRGARKKARTKRKPNPAFMRPMQPDAALSKVVGSNPMPRTEVTKKLWQYIKRKGLQDARERRMINADENLRAVFNGKSRVSMFEMTRLVNNHMK